MRRRVSSVSFNADAFDTLTLLQQAGQDSAFVDFEDGSLGIQTQGDYVRAISLKNSVDGGPAW